MATKKKLLQAAAGTAAAGGAAALNVEDVFSTYLYEGDGASQVINNNIALGNSNAGSSVEFAGGSGTEKQSLSYANNANYVVGSSNNFTIEFFVYLDAVNDNLAFGLLSGYSAYLTGMYISSGSLFGYYQTGSATQTAITTGQVLAAGQFYHVALVRNGSTFTVYLDGTSVGTSTDSIDVYDASQFFSVGNYTNSDGNVINGFVSNLRYSSTARYTSNFTPPTSDFANDSDTILLSCQGQTADLSSNSIAVTEVGSSPTLHDNFGPFTGTDGEGGMVWIKNRSNVDNHVVADTERGINKQIYPSGTFAQTGFTNKAATSFNSSGFSIGDNAQVSLAPDNFASWTFRKAPKFFTCLTYTGDGTSSRQISHDLDHTVGSVIIKRTDTTGDWWLWHRSATTYSPSNLKLNTSDAEQGGAGKIESVSSTTFTIGSANDVNASGGTYVAYLFAHNDGDGTFGPDGDQDIIKCGSYTGNGSTDGTEVDLGFEPQWVLIKNSGASYNWQIYDNMRRVTTGGDDEYLLPNSSGAEGYFEALEFNATGFKLKATGALINGYGNNYIYIAIRRGPMAVPESATEVFTPVLATSSGDFTAEAGFPVDLNWYGRRSANDGGFTWDRLRGANYLSTNSTGAETAYSAASFDSNTAFYLDGLAGDYSDFMTYNWKRAPWFFDVVAYTGDGVAGRTVSHNLGVAPEMIWVKKRNASRNWDVYHSGIGATEHLQLNTTAASVDRADKWNDTEPTASVFTLGNETGVNGTGSTYIAYLFASLDGVSKVGSYTGNGSTQTIDCGFSSGARFVLIKRTDSTGDWYVWDTERGIVSGNDPYLRLNVNAAEVTTDDSIDPVSSGFAVNQVAATNINVSSASYIFYAVS